jgi:hypothetical protein
MSQAPNELRDLDGDRAAAVWASRGRCPHGPFALGDKNMLIDLLNPAGIHDAVVTLREGTMTYPTIAVFVETEVKGSPRGPPRCGELSRAHAGGAGEAPAFPHERRRRGHADGRVYHHRNKSMSAAEGRVFFPAYGYHLCVPAPSNQALARRSRDEGASARGFEGITKFAREHRSPVRHSRRHRV